MGDEEGPRCVVSSPSPLRRCRRFLGQNFFYPEREPERPKCIVTNPAQPHIVDFAYPSLSRRPNCFLCGKKSEIDYYCTICDIKLQCECFQIPSKIIHPYHPQHPLTFTLLSYETGIIVNTNSCEFQSFLHRSGLDFSQYIKTIKPKSNNSMFDKCTWCTNDLGEWFYRCSICNFSLDFHCARNSPPLTIQNPKNHHHSLTLFPRPLFFPCDACGLINVLEPSYACYQCNFVVHKSCIDLPRVIKITRHPHRLTHTPCLPNEVLLCRVCYKNVDIKYGQYSCSYEGCSYVVHSKCATHEKIWDGKELEWEPEESETEDIAPFKTVGDGLIKHFGHDHHVLRLEKYHDGVRGIEKKCEACMHPIIFHDFYNCIECDYVLHQVCANLPRILDHALHKHPLLLDPRIEWNPSLCSTCSRHSSGFKYKCRDKECIYNFQLDMNCILIPECFTHKSHQEHLVFISTSYKDGDRFFCQGCKRSVGAYHLQCTQSHCDFAICFTCATIADEIYHKYDVHPLSLCYGESGVDNMYWCEVCETRLDPTEWFYTNKESCTTIHHKCLFRSSALLKPGYSFPSHDDNWKPGYAFPADYNLPLWLNVVGNGGSSRHICFKCKHRCPDLVCFTLQEDRSSSSKYICSFDCLTASLPHPPFSRRPP